MPIHLHHLAQNYLVLFGLALSEILVDEELKNQLLDTIAQFDATAVDSPETCDTQARYLAEEIYLAHYRHNHDLEPGVIKFIEAFA